jgi:hypothetical protein
MFGSTGASVRAVAAGEAVGAAHDGAAHVGAAGAHLLVSQPPHAWAAPVPTNAIETLNTAELTKFNMIYLLDLS